MNFTYFAHAQGSTTQIKTENISRKLTSYLFPANTPVGTTVLISITIDCFANSRAS